MPQKRKSAKTNKADKKRSDAPVAGSGQSATKNPPRRRPAATSPAGRTPAKPTQATAKLTRAGIIEFLVARHSQPAQLPSWSWVVGDKNCRSFDRATFASSLTELRGAHDEAELLSTGVFRKNGTGGISLHPAFEPSTAGPGTCLVLRNLDGIAFDLVTASGTLSGVPSLHACGYDAPTQTALRACSEEIVHAVFFMDDLVLLRSLKLPVILVDGLESLSLKDLGALLCWTGGLGSRVVPAQPLKGDRAWGGNGSWLGEQALRPPRFKLWIHAWSPAASAVDREAGFPPALQSVVRGLTEPCRFLGINWNDLFVVVPSLDGRGAWAYAARQRSTRLLRECLGGTNSDNGLYAYYAPEALLGRAQPPPSPHPLLEARDALEHSRLHDGIDIWLRQRPDLELAYQAAFDAHIVRPLLERALAQPDTHRRSLGMLTAALTQVVDLDLQRVQHLR